MIRLAKIKIIKKILEIEKENNGIKNKIKEFNISLNKQLEESKVELEKCKNQKIKKENEEKEKREKEKREKEKREKEKREREEREEKEKREKEEEKLKEEKQKLNKEMSAIFNDIKDKSNPINNDKKDGTNPVKSIVGDFSIFNPINAFEENKIENNKNNNENMNLIIDEDQNINIDKIEREKNFYSSSERNINKNTNFFQSSENNSQTINPSQNKFPSQQNIFANINLESAPANKNLSRNSINSLENDQRSLRDSISSLNDSHDSLLDSQKLKPISFECSTFNLAAYIYEGTEKSQIEIKLINNGTQDWPKNKTKLVFDQKSEIKHDDIKLKDQKVGEEVKYEVKFENLAKLKEGEYQSYARFVVNGTKYGEKLIFKNIIKKEDNQGNEVNKYMDKIQEFREGYGLEENEYSNERILEVLKNNNFDFDQSFNDLFS